MRTHRIAALVLLAGATAFTPSFVLAGPPMVCHEIVIGKEKSLPWEGGRGGCDSKYDTKNLIRDTVKLLGAEPDTLVRMETIRRATVYISYEKGAARQQLAYELLSNLVDRALEGEAADKRGPAAWFDAGYLIGCFNQLDMKVGSHMGEAEGISGYRYILKAIELMKTVQDAKPAEVAEIEFAAALITNPAARAKGRDLKTGDDDLYDVHIRRAVAAAPKGSPLDVNIAAHLSNWGKSIDAVRADIAKRGASVADSH